MRPLRSIMPCGETEHNMCLKWRIQFYIDFLYLSSYSVKKINVSKYNMTGIIVEFLVFNVKINSITRQRGYKAVEKYSQTRCGPGVTK